MRAAPRVRIVRDELVRVRVGVRVRVRVRVRVGVVVRVRVRVRVRIRDAPTQSTRATPKRGRFRGWLASSPTEMRYL